MLIAIAAVAAFAVVALVSLQSTGNLVPARSRRTETLPASALEMARERLARGEISREEFESLERTLFP